MKASEIVDKLKSVLLSAEEPQAEIAEEQVEEQTELSAEEIEVNDPVELEGEEAPAEEPAQEMEYVSKQEFESAMAEMKAMYAAIVEKMGSEEEQMEVPEELSEQKSKKSK
jgi:hypothetical protein